MLEIEQHIPQENWFVVLLFDEGYWAIRLLRKQQTTLYAPYRPSDTAIAAGGTSGWASPTDAEGRFYLEPPEEETIYEWFTGIAPSTMKLYLQYTRRQDRMSLIAPRAVPGDIGYWEGEASPYKDPGVMTELWGVHDLYPYVNLENPLITGESRIGYLSFYITPFSYQVIDASKPEDKAKILQFLRGEKRATVRTMGDPDKPIGAPNWIISNYKMVDPAEV